MGFFFRPMLCKSMKSTFQVTTRKLNFKPSIVSASNTFYDSQSGLHIEIPESDRFQFHKTNISKNLVTKSYMQLLKQEGINSFFCDHSLTNILDNLTTMKDNNIVASIPISSLNMDNFSHIDSLLMQKVLQMEMTLTLSDVMSDNNRLYAFEQCMLSNKRCTLLIDLAQIVCPQQGEELLPTWSVIDAVAILCDKGSSVVDLKLCCRDGYLHEIMGQLLFLNSYVILLSMWLCSNMS